MGTESFFTDDSLVRRVHREQLVALGGGRTLLMQAAHPVAFAGFFAHTGTLDEPYERLHRTAQMMDTIAFGPSATAERATRRVRAMHRRVRGVLAEPVGRFPAGTPYAADDPELLLWVLACLADSSLLAYERYVARLSDDEREAYWQDYRVIGGLFGLADGDMPADHAAFRAYMDDMVGGDRLHVSPPARELAVRIVMRPPVPLQARPLLELFNFVTVGLLPGRLRRGFGFSWDPARAIALHAGAEYTRRVLIPVLPRRMRLISSARREAA